jgi:nuclear transport factor 2 (NTF2) superfamily protein
MKMKLFATLAIASLYLVPAFAQEQLTENTRRPATGETSEPQFERLMRTLAEGWNEGNARKAANCFTEDAIYTQPPDKQLYMGREALFKFFGGDQGRKSQMKMTWHHLAFNRRKQIGTGEFTFEYGSKVHGMVIVKITNARISNWREYWYESDLDWEKFIGKNKF